LEGAVCAAQATAQLHAQQLQRRRAAQRRQRLRADVYIAQRAASTSAEALREAAAAGRAAAGIKVDKGVVDLPGTDGESTTQVRGGRDRA